MNEQKKQHAPEPWQLLGSGTDFETGPWGIVDKDFGIVSGSYWVQEIDGDADSMVKKDAPQFLADYKRIVACVNACQGIATETLQLGFVKDALDGLGISMTKKDE